MLLEIQSTTIREDGKGNVSIELTISDGSALAEVRGEHKYPQEDDALHAREETLFLRVLVPANHPYLRGFQSDAIKRAITILQSVRDNLPKLGE